MPQVQSRSGPPVLPTSGKLSLQKLSRERSRRAMQHAATRHRQLVLMAVHPSAFLVIWSRWAVW